MKKAFISCLLTIIFISSLATAVEAPEEKTRALTRAERLLVVNGMEQELEEAIKAKPETSEEQKKEMRAYIAYLKDLETWPHTLDEAVEKTIEVTPKDYLEYVAKLKKKDLPQLHLTFGAGIRNTFGLWKGNPELIQSVCKKECHPDEASEIIILAVWKKLQK